MYSGSPPHQYLTEGIGEDFWPTTYDTRICDVVVRVSDRDSMLTARVATAQGIDQSCGTALWAALQMAREIDDPDALFVVLLPDSGRNYVAKLFSDEWLRDRGILGRPRKSLPTTGVPRDRTSSCAASRCRSRADVYASAGIQRWRASGSSSR